MIIDFLATFLYNTDTGIEIFGRTPAAAAFRNSFSPPLLRARFDSLTGDKP
jgi:hypothetical protein